MKIIKVAVDGTTTEVAGRMSLKDMQDWVGGYIEYAPKHMIAGNINIICNEEGIRLNLPRNKIYPAFLGNIILEQMSKKPQGKY